MFILKKERSKERGSEVPKDIGTVQNKMGPGWQKIFKRKGRAIGKGNGNHRRAESDAVGSKPFTK